MTGRLVVETDRLWLREFVREDAEAFYELGSNPEVTRYTGDGGFTSLAQAEAVLCERPIADYRKYGFGRWAIVVKDSSRIVGFAGLKYLDDLGEVDVGYRLLPDFWGRGLATEAAQACVGYGFQSLKLQRILGLVVPANVASVRVLEKSGLVFERTIEYESQQLAQYAARNPALSLA
jgi:ribosomal-protein-alanine N-acetyltransferase